MVPRIDARRTANLPADGLIHRQLYSERAQRFLVHITVPLGTTQRRAVYTRHRTEPTYRRLGPRLRRDSWEEIVAVGRKLFALEMHTNQRGSISSSIVMIDLVTTSSRIISNQLDCRPMKILGASDDGRWLYFISGPWVNRAGEIPVGDYFFARLSLTAKKFQRLEKLAGNV